MDGFQVVADVLLVEGGLRAAGVVGCGGPVAGGVGGENLVGEDDCVVQQTELELGVGEDQTFAGCMLCGFVVDVKSKSAKRIGVGWAYGLFHGLIGDVFVVAAGVDFGRRGEDGFGQAIGFA